MFDGAPAAVLTSAGLPRSEGPAAAPSRGRITASTFRALTARLRHESWAPPPAEPEVAWPVIPDIVPHVEPTSPSEPAAVQPAENDSPADDLSAEAPAPLPVEVHSVTALVDEAALEPNAARDLPGFYDEIRAHSGIDDIALPAFIPLERAPAAPSPAEAEEVLAVPVEAEDAPPAFAPPVPDEMPALAAEPLEAPTLDQPVVYDDDSALPELQAGAETDTAAAIDIPHDVIPEVEAAEQPGTPLEPALGIEAASPAIPDIQPTDEVSVADLPQPVEQELAPAPSETPELAAPTEPETITALAGEPEPAPSADELPAETTAPSVSSDEEASAPPSATASDAPDAEPDDRLRALRDMIYARPSAAEQAAFLRDVADMLEAEAPASPAPGADGTTLPREIAAKATLAELLADRLGPHAILTAGAAKQPDPFAAGATAAPRPVYVIEAGDEAAGAQALSLLDIMGNPAAQPQERALASDTLLHLVPRIPAKQLLAIVERLSVMDAPPALLVARLLRDPRPEIVAPLIERCSHINDQNLIAVVLEGDQAKRRLIARRRVVSAQLADALIEHGDTSVLLTLVRNPGATLSHDAFHVLAEAAKHSASLLAPLVTRDDVPAPVAFDLFWYLPTELRRYVLSRFLTDSENLNRILKITRAGQEGAEPKFPSREALEAALERACAGDIGGAAERLAAAGAIDNGTALRLLSDKHGEPLAVALKAMGYQRSRFAETIERLTRADAAVLSPDLKLAEIEGIFDSLSFNKARTLLTYWDWAVLGKGPYAPHH